MSWEPIILSFKLGLMTTVLLLMISIPLAYALAFSQSRFKFIWETLISMPLVLPPTVIGFYLMTVFSPQSYVGSFFNKVFGVQLLFSFEGLVIASIVYSLPFMVHPIHSGFSHLPAQLREVSYTLGKSRITTLWRILLPNIKSSIITACVLTFAHTLGEFGVVLMIGGNIPHETRVASIAIYDEVEALHYSTANQYAFILFAITFIVLLVVFFQQRNPLKAIWK